MRCQQTEKQLPEYLEGSLSPSAQEAVRRHLDECDRCRQAYRSLETLSEWTQASVCLPAEVPAGLLQGVRERIKKPSRSVRLRPWWWQKAPVLAAALAVLIVASLLPRGPSAASKEDFERALNLYDKAFEYSGRQREARLRESLKLLEAFCEKYADDEVLAPVALLFLADCHRQQGRADQAVETYRDILRRFPSDREIVIETRTALTGLYLNGFNDPERAAEEALWLLDHEKDWPGLVELCVAVAEKYEPVSRREAFRWYVKAEGVENPGSAAARVAAQRRQAMQQEFLVDSYLTDCWMIGPFDNSGQFKFSYAHPPEEEIDLEASYPGMEQEVRWRRVTDAANLARGGHIDLFPMYEPNQYAAVYVLTYLYSPDERKVRFLMGSDDSIRFWLNDELVWSNPANRGYGADQDRPDPLFVHQGWNKILLRVSNDAGLWGFSLRVTDQDHGIDPDLRFDPLRGEKS